MQQEKQATVGCVHDDENLIDNQVMKYLKMLDKPKDISQVAKPTPLRVSTRSAMCKLTHPIDVPNMAAIFEQIWKNKTNPHITGVKFKNKDLDISVGMIQKKKRRQPNTARPQFYNQATIVIRPGDETRRKVNIKFFHNGSISMTGCLNDVDGIEAMDIFFNEINKHPSIFLEPEDQGQIQMKDYAITLINSDYIIGFKLDRLTLFKLLIQAYKVFVTFDPTIYPGVKISFMWNKMHDVQNGICKCIPRCRMDSKQLRKKNTCKIVTVAIFQSGRIIITGASHIQQTRAAYDFVNQVLYEHYDKLVRFSITDCLENN